MDESGEKAFAERAGSGDVLVRSGESPPKLLTKVARAIGDHVVLWVRFPDGSRRKAKPVLGDWMGGTEQRPWPDVAIMGEEPTDGVSPVTIPGPLFKFGERVEVAYSKGTQTGTVEERSRREFRDKPGEWLYKVSWDGMTATSVLPEKDLRVIELRDNPHLTDEQRAAVEESVARELEAKPAPDGWQGTPPGMGTRRKTILDAVRDELEPGRNFSRCLAIADRIESALLQTTIAEEEGAPIKHPNLAEVDRQLREKREEAIAAHRLLDGLGIEKGPEIHPPTVLNRLHRLATRYIAANEKLGRLYRDDEWAQRFAMAAVVAGQEADTPFPADTLDEVLREFGVTPTHPRDWPSRSDRAATVPDEAKSAVLGGARSGKSTSDVYQAVLDAVDEEAIAKGAEALTAGIEKVSINENEERLYEQREQARAGESRLMEQRNAALGLLRWLIGDLIPPYPGFEEEED